jgi:RsiW-degrading membrane proteinase PrsW (M82 family)
MLNLLSVVLPLLLAFLIAARFRTKLNSRDSTILVVSFLISLLTVIPSIMIKKTAEELGFRQEAGYSVASNVLFANLSFAFFAAFVDELNKYIVVVAYAYRRKEYDEPMAGILVAVMIALGFTLSENAYFILSDSKDFNHSWKLLANIPAALSFAVIMGFNAGMSKYGLDSDDLSSMGLRMKGLFLATFYHAFYSFFIGVEDYRSVMIFIVIIGLILLIQVGLALFRSRRLHVRLMYSRSRRAKQSMDNPFS